MSGICGYVDLFAFLREAQLVAERQRAIDERINLLENVEPTADDGPGIDRLRAAVEALRAWLRAAPASSIRPARSPTRPPNRIIPWVAGWGSGPVP